LINACRGPVVDNAALLQRLQAGQALSVVLDVWEPEPDLNTELLKRVDIGTRISPAIPSKAKRAVRRRF
jgi:erythronate-4-phosphate dehydrogenase